MATSHPRSCVGSCAALASARRGTPCRPSSEEATHGRSHVAGHRDATRAIGRGLHLHLAREDRGREYDIDFETTEWEPPHSFGVSLVRSDFFKSCDERWVIERIDAGSRFSLNDRTEFPHGPLCSVIGFFAAWTARKVGGEVLAELKRLAEADDRGALKT